MPQTSKGLLYSFALALFLTLFVPVFFSDISIHFFIPPLVMALYRTSPSVMGWLSFGVGIFLDCILCMPRIGFLGLSYFVASSTLYSKRVFFFKDTFSTLPILTYFFSVISTAVESLSCLLLDLQAPPITWKWLFSDCLISPTLDVAYALLFFSLPHFFFTQYYGTMQQETHTYDDA